MHIAQKLGIINSCKTNYEAVKSINLLVKLRKKNKLSQEEVAKRLGIARNTLHSIEIGKCDLKVKQMITLSNLYEMKVVDLLQLYTKE